ncbi:hypothetical protein [Marinoscillum furvescens]|uniref:Outer membrane protein with beta-barrel domain n=1 Tax=Marinoscillum furvescens DSM 4134 TaxID=1122208 RepID=A0A3D9LI83_MARFU|nr:hypothetical protein [Marinoscillum furvescens]REE05533.1 hypothetical protein C7460_10148 [Marinoscillum furvescens DSM 4134]
MKGLLTALVILASLGAYSQKYGTTLGLRLGNDITRTIGITAEQRLFKRITAEGILQSDLSRNHTAHLLIRRHYPLLSKRLTIFTGAGASLGLEESKKEVSSTQEVITTYGNETLGIDLMVGAELTLLGFSVSLDYKPNINLAGRESWIKNQVGVSVRTVLIKDRQRKKNQRQRKRARRKKDRQN